MDKATLQAACLHIIIVKVAGCTVKPYSSTGRMVALLEKIVMGWAVWIGFQNGVLGCRY